MTNSTPVARWESVVTRNIPSCELQDVNLTINPEERRGLVGDLFDGPTTMLRLLVGLVTPTEGAVTLREKNPTLPSHRTGISYAPLIPEIPPSVTVEQHLSMVAELQNVSSVRSEVDRVIPSLELEEVRNYKVKSLERTELRKIAVGQGLMGDPEVRILNHPTLHTSPSDQDLIFDQIDQSVGESSTLILASNRMRIAQSLCDDIAHFKTGQLSKDNGSTNNSETSS
ncbi:MAG: ATP-binding cassette domain-containing protein [bacterium]